jgi:hypothetical protein
VASAVVVVGLVVVAIAAGLAVWTPWRALRVDALGQATAAYAERDWAKAAAVARALLRAEPTNPGGLLLLARSSTRQRNDEAAEILYRRLGVEALQPEDFLLMARVLSRRGQAGPAQAIPAMARLKAPEFPEVLEAVFQAQLDNQGLIQAGETAERQLDKPGWEIRGMVTLQASGMPCSSGRQPTCCSAGRLRPTPRFPDATSRSRVPVSSWRPVCSKPGTPRAPAASSSR